MNKTGFLLLITAFASIFSFDRSGQIQAQKYDKGSIVLNAGAGLLGSVSYYGRGLGLRRSPVMSVTGEYGALKVGPGVMGFGGAFGFQTASYKGGYGSYHYTARWTALMFGARATYHPDFLNSEKYDVYGVAQIGYTHFTYSYSSNDPLLDGFNYTPVTGHIRPYAMVGGRYYFTKTFGVFSEIGYDLSYIKAGITLHFH